MVEFNVIPGHEIPSTFHMELVAAGGGSSHEPLPTATLDSPIIYEGKILAYWASYKTHRPLLFRNSTIVSALRMW